MKNNASTSSTNFSFPKYWWQFGPTELHWTSQLMGSLNVENFPWKYVAIPDKVFVFSEECGIKWKFPPETAKIITLDHRNVGLECQETKGSSSAVASPEAVVLPQTARTPPTHSPKMSHITPKKWRVRDRN